MSSDSEDETMAMVREAMDTQFLNDNMYKEKNLKETKAEVKLLPSLRRSKLEEDEALNYFKVTPEFQAHVSKHLSKIIEEKLQGMITDNDVIVDNKKRKVKGGVKLFRDSTSYVKLKKEKEEDEIIPKKNVVSASMEEMEDKCAEAAVDPKDVISKKDVKYWKSRHRSSLHIYKKMKDGVCRKENVVRDFF